MYKIFNTYKDPVIAFNDANKVVYKNKGYEDIANLKLYNKNNKKVAVTKNIKNNLILYSHSKTKKHYLVKKLTDKNNTIILLNKFSYFKENIDTFGMVSHDMKNILANIKAYNELIQLKTKQIDSKIGEYAKKVDTNVNLLTQLVNDLVDTAKAHTATLQIAKQKINLDNLVNETVENFKQTLESHNIIIKGNTNIEINADPMRIKQVLINLISNAIKYSPEGKNIVIELSNTAQSVILKIRDFGIGIPKKEHKKIFEPYYRIDRSKTKGIGVGLYIAKQIILKHNGKIFVESEENKGSTFTIYLPTK